MGFLACAVGFSAKTATAVGVSVGLIAAAAAGAPPAGADTTANSFLSALSGSGVSYADPGTAVTMAQSICPLLAQPGGNFAAVASQMGGTNGISPGMANLFTSIAISMYCPSMMSSLAGGNWLGAASQMNGIPGLSGLTGMTGIPGI